MLRIAIAAGEASGDQLGSELIYALKKQYPGCDIAGVAGAHMVAAGCRQVVDVQHLSVMGLLEVVASLPRLLICRAKFSRFLSNYQPHIYIGIDAPDFNLSLAKKMKKKGVFTVQYNSPKVWAWRRYRVKKIQRAVSLMLTQFPFEAEFYQPYRVAAEYIGHSFADVIQPAPTTLDPKHPRIALVLGSRRSEIRYHARLAIQTAEWLSERLPDCTFVVPLLNESHRIQWLQYLKKSNTSVVFQVVVGDFRTAMRDVDLALTAAGTATLELMLLRKPMVVMYRLSAFTYAIAKRLVQVAHIALPNLLAKERLVSEWVQNEATPETLGTALLALIHNPGEIRRLQGQFAEIHDTLRGKAAINAVNLIASGFEGPYSS